MYHTHPHGSVEPSVSDLSTTQSIINICLFNGIDLDDHIILNETEHYSFKKQGLIDGMKSKYASVFAVTDVYAGSLNTKPNNKK